VGDVGAIPEGQPVAEEAEQKPSPGAPSGEPAGEEREGRILRVIEKLRDMPDEAAMRARRRRSCLLYAILAFTVVCLFCLLISALMGVPQMFFGWWWMSPPRYPDAVLVKYVEGEVCQSFQPAVFCYEYHYRTDDSVEDVIAYYENLDWALHDPIKFEWQRGRRFGFNWVAEHCIRYVGHVACFQIIARPSLDEQGNTEIYILERGAVGEIRRSDQ